MPIGEEDYSSNLQALGRFKPASIAGADGSGDLDVTLETNLAGEAIRFSMNEALDNIVSSATLTMLNAIIGDDDVIQVGLMGEEKTEEDEARWGELYNSAPVEPNQLVWVTEAGGGLGSCTTYWRVVGVTSYVSEEDVPYYDVQLEGMGQIAIDEKFVPSKIVTETTMAWFYTRDYYDSMRNKYQVDADNDGYITEEESILNQTILNSIINGARYIVESNDEYLVPFLNQLTAKGLDCGVGAIPALSLVPIDSKIMEGESCWQIIEDILALNGYMARFTREKRLVVIDLMSDEGWSYTPSAKGDDGTPIYNQEDLDNPPLEDVDMGTFGSGLQLSYSKEGVYSQALVTGRIGKIGEDDLWVVDGEEETTTIVTSSAGRNILNGETVELGVQVDERYQLSSIEELENFGRKELYKCVTGARSATYDSDTIPLDVEVGMVVTGSSKLGGTTNIFITALNRTTDAQQNKISTGISGTRVYDGAASSETSTLGWE